MANEERKVTVKIEGEESGLNSSLNRSQGLFDKFKKQAVIAGAAVAAAFVAIGVKAVKAFEEAEVAQKKTLAALKATGSQAGVTANDIFKLSSEIQKYTTYGDEAITNVQTSLLKFTNIKKDIFEPTTRAIVDMAAALGTDLNSAALYVGRALEDPIQGMTLLRRSGINFTGEQKEQIKALLQGNDVLGAQTIILNELQSKFAGTAQTMANGTGVFTQIKEDIGDIFEQIGEVIFRFIQPATIQIRDFFREIKESGAAQATTYTIMEVGKTVIMGLAQVLEVLYRGLKLVFTPLAMLADYFSDTSVEVEDSLLWIDRWKIAFAKMIATVQSIGYKAVSYWYDMKAGIYEARAALAVFDGSARTSYENAAEQARKTAEAYKNSANDIANLDLTGTALDYSKEQRGTGESTTFGVGQNEFDKLFGGETGRTVISTGEGAGAGAGKEELPKDLDSLAALNQSGLGLMSEDQREAMLDYLQNQREEDLDGIQKYQLRVLENEQDFQNRMNETVAGALAVRFRTQDASNAKTEAATKDFNSNMLALANSSNRELQAVGKAYAVASAIYDTYVAANKALAAFAPPFSYVAAAAAIAYGLQNVATIRSTQPVKAAAMGGIVGGTDIGRDTQTMQVRAGEAIIPSQYVTPLLPTLAQLVKQEETKGFVDNGGGQLVDVQISLVGDAGSFIDATLRRDRTAGVI